jgi:ankyrin repeat protein
VWGHPEVAKLSIEAGADVNAKQQEGFTALQAASANGHKGIVNLLR